MECEVTKETLISLFLKDYLWIQENIQGACSTPDDLPMLDFGCLATIIRFNNTPPASLPAFGLECSAPRGVTRFWGTEK